MARLARIAAAALLFGVAGHAAAPDPPPPLKNVVILIGAPTTNDTLTAGAQPGPLNLPLSFQVLKGLEKTTAFFMVSDFQIGTATADVVATSLALASQQAPSMQQLPVTLEAGTVVTVTLRAAPLAPGMAYKGWIQLVTPTQTTQWNLTITTSGNGTLKAEPVGTVQFVTWPFASGEMGRFDVVLRDKSGHGSYANLQAYFEPTAPSSKTTRSNLSTDTFTFYLPAVASPPPASPVRQTKAEQPASAQPGSPTPAVVPAAQTGGQSKTAGGTGNLRGAGQGAGMPGQSKDAPAAVPSRQPLDLGSGQSNVAVTAQRQITVAVAALTPGEYAGKLQFNANGAAEDAGDSAIALVLQVRHHWLPAVAMLIFGSLVGWFSAQWVVAARKGRALVTRMRELQRRADHLARRDTPRARWRFSSEATSFALVKTRVLFSQLAGLGRRIVPMLTGETEIKAQQAEAEVRLAKIERLRETRLAVERLADERPAVQLTLGRLLRTATSLLEQPTLTEAQQTQFDAKLQEIQGWLDDQARAGLYRAALVRRLNSQEVPARDMIVALPAGALQAEVLRLFDAVAADTTLGNQAATEAQLQAFDDRLAKLILLWREKDRPWAGDLAAASLTMSAQPLFDLVDEKFWNELQAPADPANPNGPRKHTFAIQPDTTSGTRVETFEPVEVTLTSAPDDTLTGRMLFHPLRVVWTVTPSASDGARTTETDGMKLVQYFDAAATVTVSARLSWHGSDIPVTGTHTLTVVENPDYRGWKVLQSNMVELAVLGIAIVFAVATAMSTVYDSTFGSLGQYLGLFVWAAGAATGGNAFKQLGTTNTPGGSADSALPTR